MGTAGADDASNEWEDDDEHVSDAQRARRNKRYTAVKEKSDRVPLFPKKPKPPQTDDALTDSNTL